MLLYVESPSNPCGLVCVQYVQRIMTHVEKNSVKLYIFVKRNNIIVKIFDLKFELIIEMTFT